MTKNRTFLTPQEEQEVIEAIRTAEKNTSGEIRVHIEQTAAVAPFERAMEVFHLLKMDTTRLRNGVLIYVAVKDRAFVIYGDKGINDVVPDNFWDTTRDVMASHFKNGHFKQGITAGILNAGAQLRAHFPWHKNDKNELDDSISTG